MEKYPGRLVIVGDVNMGGFEHPRDPVAIAELTIDKGEKILLVPVSCRQDPFKLPDSMATKVDIEYFPVPK